jgi:hypothetical protein
MTVDRRRRLDRIRSRLVIPTPPSRPEPDFGDMTAQEVYTLDQLLARLQEATHPRHPGPPLTEREDTALALLLARVRM